MEEFRHVLVANNLKVLIRRESVKEMSFEVREVIREASPRGGSQGKHAMSYFDAAKIQGDSQTMASTKRRVPPS